MQDDMLLVADSSMIPAALLACLYFLFCMQAGAADANCA
jgi:hypothetical protein